MDRAVSEGGITFSVQVFGELFPFHFGFGEDGRVSHLGPSLRRLVPDVRLGDPLSGFIKPGRSSSPLDFGEIARRTGQLYIVQLIKTGLRLRGQMQPLGDRIFFLGSPWLSMTNELRTLGLKLNNFAVHDPTMDMLQLLQIQKLAVQDLKDVSRRLEDSETMLRMIFNALPIGIVIHNRGGGLDFSNQYLQTARGSQMLEAINLPHPEYAKGTEKAFELMDSARGDQLQDQQITEYEIELPHTDTGPAFRVVHFLVPPSKAGDHRLGSLVIEITRQKQLERDIRSASERQRVLLEMQREFTTLVSHEFRTPLTVIKNAHFMLSKALDPASPVGLRPQVQPGKWLGLQNMALAQLQELVEQVLVLNRLEHATTAAHLTRVQPALIVRELTGQMNAAFLQTRIEVRDELPACFMAELDRNLCRSALSNLISNALKYSAEDDQVLVRLYQSGQGWSLAVTDQGCGIPEADRAGLFRPFFRAGNVGSVPGAGLGLAIVKKSVEFHQGTVEFVSKENEGSTFTVYFPASASKAWGGGPVRLAD